LELGYNCRLTEVDGRDFREQMEALARDASAKKKAMKRTWNKIIDRFIFGFAVLQKTPAIACRAARAVQVEETHTHYLSYRTRADTSLGSK
jgi:hypothetical protein